MELVKNETQNQKIERLQAAIDAGTYTPRLDFTFIAELLINAITPSELVALNQDDEQHN